MRLYAATSNFESALLEHLDAAYNLARWLVGNDQDAQDVVQDSSMKALRAFDTFRGGDFRAWFLTIVRNTSFTCIKRNKGSRAIGEDPSVDAQAMIAADAQTYDPQLIAIRAADAECARRAIDALPDALRETLVLREMEELSYKEIGKIVGVPIGTVMSRLSRARVHLQSLLAEVDPDVPQPSVREGTR